MKHFIAPLLLLAAAYSLRADTIVFKNDDELDGKVLERDELTLKVEVECGTVLVPLSKVKRIDPDTPEKAEEREKRKAAAAELATRMKDEGKVQYKGKWVTEDEKKADEDKIAAAKKKKAEEAKKKAEAEAKAKAAADAAALALQQQQQQLANQDNSRGDRFSRRHGRDDNQLNYRQDNYNNTNQQFQNGNYNWSNQMGGYQGGRR
jgi:hypothetical protein